MKSAKRSLKAIMLMTCSATALVSVLLVGTAMPIAAQDSTPIPALPTYTPAGPTVAPTVVGAATNATAAPAAPGAIGTVNPNATPGGKIMDAYFKAKAALAKAIKKYIGAVQNYTYAIIAFTDDGLGCAGAGTPVHQGYNGGYAFVYTLLDGSKYEVHTNADATNIVICPTVGGAAAAGAVAAGGHLAAGSFEIGGQVQQFSLGTAGHMNQAKMKWVKFQSDLGDASMATNIASAHTQGFKALISLKGQAGAVLGAGYFDTYAAFAATLATAGADAIEVWNEQNLDREWPNGQINPATYVQLLQKADAAIKAAHPSTLVISGALAPTGAAGPGGENPAYWNDDHYYSGMAAAGAANYADCIGAHYNEGVVSPTQSSGDPRDSYPTRYFQTMLARVTTPFPSSSVCFTELGFLSPEGYGPLPAGFTWAANTTAANQAQWLSQAAVLASQSGHVRLMIVFNVDFSYYGADPQAGYAIIRPGGVCPGCDALAAIAS